MAETDPTRPRGAKDVNRGRRWALIVLAVVLLLFMALNSQKVEVNLIFGSAEMPLIFALLIAACLGALVGWVVPKVRRPER